MQEDEARGLRTEQAWRELPPARRCGSEAARGPAVAGCRGAGGAAKRARDAARPTTLPEPARRPSTPLARLCPIPIVKTAAAVKGLATVRCCWCIATDPGIATDMPMWCKATRHEHLATFRDGGQLEELPCASAGRGR
ncbi:MAG: sulfurtransferase TusA family protein [Desulfobacterales bacterium]|nr:sulfurtransferase TusA family protein [Desulfobacterales bacterium]